MLWEVQGELWKKKHNWSIDCYITVSKLNMVDQILSLGYKQEELKTHPPPPTCGTYWYEMRILIEYGVSELIDILWIDALNVDLNLEFDWIIGRNKTSM